MLSLKQIIDEALFGSIDSEEAINIADENVINMWLQKNCRGKYNLLPLKKGLYRMSGYMMIHTDDADIPFTLKSLQGSITLDNCPNLENPNSLFDKVVKTSKAAIIIDGCPNITNLDWIPDSIAELHVTNCKNIKTLPEGKTVTKEVVFHKNGKRWSEDQVNKTFDHPMFITCNAEDEDDNIIEESENINEALQIPQLVELADQLRKRGSKKVLMRKTGNKYNTERSKWTKYKYSDDDRTYGILDKLNIQIDKIPYSCVTVYRDPDAKTIRDNITKFIRDGEYTPGIILCADNNGEYNYVIVHDGYRSGDIYNKKYDTLYDFMSYSFSARYDILKNSAKIVVIDLINIKKGEDKLSDIRTSRRKNKEDDIIPGDIEKMKSIAMENLRRYKEQLQSIRAMKDDRLMKTYENIYKYMEFYQRAMNELQTHIIKLRKDNRPMYGISTLLNYVSDMGEYLFGYKHTIKYSSNGRFLKNPRTEMNTGVYTWINEIMSLSMSKTAGQNIGKDYNPISKIEKELEEKYNLLKQVIENLDDKVKNIIALFKRHNINLTF